MRYVSEEERRKFFLEIINDIKKKDMELKDMKNGISGHFLPSKNGISQKNER